MFSCGFKKSPYCYLFFIHRFLYYQTSPSLLFSITPFEEPGVCYPYLQRHLGLGAIPLLSNWTQDPLSGRTFMPGTVNLVSYSGFVASWTPEENDYGHFPKAIQLLTAFSKLPPCPQLQSKKLLL